MGIRIIQLGTPRAAARACGSARCRRAACRRRKFASRNYYDVWLPTLSPVSELVAQAQAAETEAEWNAFRRHFRAEMAHGDAPKVLDLLAALSATTAFSIGCYCDDERHCHRSSCASCSRSGAAIGRRGLTAVCSGIAQPRRHAAAPSSCGAANRLTWVKRAGARATMLLSWSHHDDDRPTDADCFPAGTTRILRTRPAWRFRRWSTDGACSARSRPRRWRIISARHRCSNATCWPHSTRTGRRSRRWHDACSRKSAAGRFGHADRLLGIHGERRGRSRSRRAAGAARTVSHADRRLSPRH